MANNFDITDISNQDNRSKRGFASIDKERQDEISKGGKATHEKNAALESDSEEDKEAGRREQAKHNPSSGTYGIDCLDPGNNMLDKSNLNL